MTELIIYCINITSPQASFVFRSNSGNHVAACLTINLAFGFNIKAIVVSRFIHQPMIVGLVRVAERIPNTR